MSPMETVYRAWADATHPDPKVWVDQWAEQNRVLPADTPEPGPYRNTRTPYLIDIQRTMSPSTQFREGWFKKPHQIGGSVSGENLIGAWICTAAGSMLLVFPTLDDGKQWELSRFEPMRASTRELRKRVRSADTKGADNTKLRKKYPGGVMRIVGANRVGALKSATIRYIKFEEPDEYVLDLGEQGHPIELAKKRTTNFGRKAKIFGDGTPTIKDHSAIDANFQRGDRRLWHLYCPDCKHPQPLVWEQIKLVDSDPRTAKYACVACGVLNPEHTWKRDNYAQRPPGMTEEEAKAAGLAHWEATASGEPGVASWHMSSLGAPLGWRPWVDLAQERIEADKKAADGDPEPLKVFTNNELGEVWSETISSEITAEKLQQRAEQYDLMTCPQRGLICTAAVDTQDNRLAVVIRAFGRGEESWGIWHGEIYGHPSSPETWQKLRDLLEAPIRHESGQMMRVDAAAIDAGGHHGEDVFAFCRAHQARGKHWFAVRGATKYDAPKLGKPKTIEFTWRGKAVPGGAQLRFLGTQSIKTVIDNRLKLDTPGGGYYHFPMGFGEEYYKQLRSEKRELRRDKQGNKALWWIKGSERNEAWDCEVYVYAAYLYAMSGQHAEIAFRQREKLYAPVLQLELLDDGAPAPKREADAPSKQPAEEAEEEPATAEPAAQAVQQAKRTNRRRGSFVQRR